MSIPQTDTDICNQALAHLGQTRFLSDLDTDRGTAATLCRTFFDTMRESVFSEYPWSRATKTAALDLIEELDDDEEWDFKYRYPVDCLFARRIQSDYRTDSADSRIPYRVVLDDDGTVVILTDREDARLEYTVRVDDVSQDPAKVALAQSSYLAFLLAPGLTGGDPFKLGQRAANTYASIIAGAKANDASEETPDQPPDASWIRARR